MFEEMVVTTGTIVDAGTLGTIGLSGWYIPSYAVRQYPDVYLDFWRAYTRPLTTSLFTKAGSTPDELLRGAGRAFVPAWCALETTPTGCAPDDPDLYSARLCNVIVWNPSCIELLAIEDTYDMGMQIDDKTLSRGCCETRGWVIKFSLL
jgi:hypothetical protein